MAGKLRVLLADDHVPTRAGVRAALEDHGFEIIAEVGDAPAAVESAIALRPDVCLLDINMPGSGITAAADISSQLPQTAIVMLTVSRDDQDLFDALRAGAAGYLLKDTDPARLGFALEGVLNGEAALPRTLVAKLVEAYRGQNLGRRRGMSFLRDRGASLTSREWDVLDMLREGRSTSEIADRMAISQVTVRRHVSTIVRKLQVADRDAAVRLLDES